MGVEKMCSIRDTTRGMMVYFLHERTTSSSSNTGGAA